MAEGRSQSGVVGNRLNWLVRLLVIAVVVAVLQPGQSRGEPSGAGPAATNQVEQVSSQELRQLLLQLQTQLQATQLAVEQNRQENKAAAAQNAEALTAGLESVQEVLASQRARDWATMQSSNELVLVVAGAFAAMSLLTLLVMTYFQWRMSKGMAEISAALPAALGLGSAASAAGLSAADPRALYLPGFSPHVEKAPQAPAGNPHPAAKRANAPGMPLGSRLLFDPGAVWRRRRIRAIRTVVIVCLVCAAALALLLYLMTCRKLGFGALHAVLRL